MKYRYRPWYHDYRLSEASRMDKAWEIFQGICNFILFNRRNEGEFLFRGQADETWMLDPKLCRDELKTLSIAEHLEVEDAELRSYMPRAWAMADRQTLPDQGEEDLLGWWAVMQHHGAPTRLLDWTTNPYTACYFAARDRQDTDGAIWYFNVTSLNKSIGVVSQDTAEMPRYFGTMSDSRKIHLIKPTQPTSRMLAQRGMLSVCRSIKGNPTRLIPQALARYAGEKSPFGRIIIPAKYKDWFTLMLGMVGFEASALFPGIDGIGATMDEFVGTYKRSLRNADATEFEEGAPQDDE